MEFQQDCPKDKKFTALLIFWLKTEKFRSTELYGAALEGSTIFLCRSSLGCTSMEGCQLADLKYAIFSSTGRKTKKLWLSIVPARRPSEHTGLGPHQKGVNCNFSWPEFDKPFCVRKLSISDA